MCALERLRDEARVPQAGRVWTVEKWFLHWLEEIVRPNTRDSGYPVYRSVITQHLLPEVASRVGDLLFGEANLGGQR